MADEIKRPPYDSPDKFDDWLINRLQDESHEEHLKRLAERHSEDQSEEIYIFRLKRLLNKLFEKHYKENEDQPQFVSDIENVSNRNTWEAQQLLQWNERHIIFQKLVEIGDREKEAITHQDTFGTIYYWFEIRQRWLTKNGKAFLASIIEGLKTNKNLWNPNTPTKGMDFKNIRLDCGESFSDFYYVNPNNNYRDLQSCDLARVELPKANIQGGNFIGANFKGANFKGANLESTKIQKVCLSNANIQYANLAKADLSQTDLRNANLRNTNLTNATIFNTDLSNADISHAKFIRASMRGTKTIKATCIATDFSNAILQGSDFSNANIRGSNFTSVKIFCDMSNPPFGEQVPTNFSAVKYKGAWHGPFCSKKHTKFHGVDTTHIDNSNRLLKKYIEDENWIQSVRSTHLIPYWFWGKATNCGKSILLLAFWCVFFAGLFGAVFADYEYPGWMPQDGWIENTFCAINPEVHIDTLGGREETFWTPYYFSIVTFTTLGFGDVTPTNLAGEIWLTIEVILGYIGLGGLVSILATKLARRS